LEKSGFQGTKFNLSVSESTHGTDTVRKHRAGALVRRNLSPLMGRRDAVLDAAALLIGYAETDPAENREILFSYLHGLLQAADSNTDRISGMFNNQDTVAREQRLALHIGILAKLAASLDDFRALEVRMQKAAALYADDPGNEFDAECTGRINTRLSTIEHNLLEQLCEYFDRVRARIARYRQYAVKNFSKEYLDCYQRSYMSVKVRCDEAFELFSVKISTPNMRSFSDEKFQD
jgi:hypothetical protein